jgi:hypothetical protein
MLKQPAAGRRFVSSTYVYWFFEPHTYIWSDSSVIWNRSWNQEYLLPSSGNLVVYDFTDNKFFATKFCRVNSMSV